MDQWQAYADPSSSSRRYNGTSQSAVRDYNNGQTQAQLQSQPPAGYKYDQYQGGLTPQQSQGHATSSNVGSQSRDGNGDVAMQDAHDPYANRQYPIRPHHQQHLSSSGRPSALHSPSEPSSAAQRYSPMEVMAPTSPYAPKTPGSSSQYGQNPAQQRASPTRPEYQTSQSHYFTRQQQQSSQQMQPVKSSSLWLYIAGAAVVGGGAGYYYLKNASGSAPTLVNHNKADYQKVYNAIAARLEEKDDYDDGSYGPVLVRLAWHASGTYDKETGTGGSNGATMRFAPESDHGANAGLKHARDFLEPIKQQFPWISYSDLWILGGVCAIQEMLGPKIPYRPGRADRDMSACTPDGRLPDASKTQDHLRDIFYRMGFNDQEIVALAGAHALGRCHTDRSGYDGPWTFSPTVLTNDYYKLLLNEKWQWRKWDGPKQLEDKTTKSLMMLPADYALIQDKTFKEWVVKYANDNDLFFRDFANVIVKLFELGVPFKQTERWEFKTLNEQE